MSIDLWGYNPHSILCFHKPSQKITKILRGKQILTWPCSLIKIKEFMRMKINGFEVFISKHVVHSKYKILSFHRKLHNTWSGMNLNFKRFYNKLVGDKIGKCSNIDNTLTYLYLIHSKWHKWSNYPTLMMKQLS